MQILPKKGWVLVSSISPPYYPRIMKETDIKGIAKVCKTRLDKDIKCMIYNNEGKEDHTVMALVGDKIHEELPIASPAGEEEMSGKKRVKV